MATNLLQGLRTHNARNLIESFNASDGSPRAYMFIGKTTPWENDSNPPTPRNNLEDYIEAHNQIMSLVRIDENEAYPMIRRNTWVTNIVYDHYAHDISVDSPAYSGATTLKESNFYVINSQRDIYVCLDNNRNSLSTEEPVNRSGDPFITSDGYQWMLIYSLNTVLDTNFTTDHYIPVVDSYDPRTAGEINTVIIQNGGTDYTDLPEGVATRVRAYYTPIIGDGTGAVAKVHVDGTTVSKIEVVRRGSGYRHASLNFVNGNVYKSLFDLDNNTTPLNPEGAGDLRTKVIIAPVNGWRYDLPLQMMSTDVGVFSQLEFDTTDLLTNVEFRQIGILQDPEITISSDLKTLSGLYGVKVIDSSDGDFNIEEEITQSNSKGLARGTLLYWDKDGGEIYYYQDYEQHNVDGVLTKFQGVERIKGATTGKIVNPETTFSGPHGDKVYEFGYSDPEFREYSGVITYLANIRPVRRSDRKSEKVCIIINF